MNQIYFLSVTKMANGKFLTLDPYFNEKHGQKKLFNLKNNLWTIHKLKIWNTSQKFIKLLEVVVSHLCFTQRVTTQQPNSIKIAPP